MVRWLRRFCGRIGLRVVGVFSSLLFFLSLFLLLVLLPLFLLTLLILVELRKQLPPNAPAAFGAMPAIYLAD